ncbi:ABC transporter substrate-binding protein [Candidatus Magnetominusculus xianensis]|uniref:Aliphatic sulfonates-binding protein n=1 Tax=Candidatus Magnetominusculus xianensis TaxID=1748249 RepID=A0ABR5SBY6_9BACT|nr:ABC transporter substrate-binding protein [Candidatus Magnetominusculus xianensis]KWT74905.1 putative aliphatic sulfonates-binding protein precursor [Candidatus Magnetominusculus xianensis]MBF0405704.1 ABC transporter substrate-binding protein [Nitrospirota bacterium]
MFLKTAIKRKVLLYTIVIFIVISITSYIFHNNIRDRSKLDRTPKKVTIASVNDLHAAVVNLAFKKGYFKDEGLDADIVQHSFGKAALKTMIAGNADFAAVAETPVMFSILKGEKIYILSSIQNSAKAAFVIARKDSGISTVDTLNGKTIGIPKGTTGDYFFYLFCMVHGIKYSELKFIDKKPEELLDALLRGEVDAVSVWQPYALEILKRLSDKVTVFQIEGIYTATFTLTAKQEYVQRNPEIVERILAGLYRAEQFMRQEPVKSQEILADCCKLDIAMVQELWGVNNFDLTLDQYLVNLLDNEAQWAISEHIVETHVDADYLDYIYLSGLKKVKPYAVSIIK